MKLTTLLKNHSHKKRKDSLEGSLDRVWFAAELEFPKPGYLSIHQIKHSICRKARMVKTTVLFIWDRLLTALIHLNFIILILIRFKLIIAGINYVIYDCSSARTTGVSLYWSFTLEEKIMAVITQDRVIDDNLKRQIKNRTLCTIRLLLPT